MSADPFRDIVKQNAHLYRDSEETRVKNTERKCAEYALWKERNNSKNKLKNNKDIDESKSLQR